MSQRNIVILTNAFAPYRAPVWDALARLSGGLDVVVMTHREANRRWRDVCQDHAYRLHNLRTRGVYINWLDSGVYFGGRVIRMLERLSPTHLILTGYTSPQYIIALGWALWHSIPVTFWYESHELSSRFRGGLARAARGMVLRRASSWIVPGTLSRSYLRGMGIPAGRIFTAPNTVDVSVYSRAATDPSRHRSGLRFLYLGQYLVRKGVRELVEAFGALPEGKATLRCVGYGALAMELRQRATRTTGIEFCDPTTTPEETALHYAWADVVVVPSIREVWGLVINEALAAGCYVVASAAAGAAPDLIGGGPRDVGTLLPGPITASSIERALRTCIAGAERIRRSRELIREWGLQWTPELTAEGLWAAVRDV